MTIHSEAPQWAYCKLNISCPSEQYIASIYDLQSNLVDDDDNSPLSFYSLIPIPDCLAKTHETLSDADEANNFIKTGYHSMLEFTLDEWGCPYDAKEPSLTWDGEDSIEYDFRTQGTPPIAWIVNVSKQFPELIFEIEAVHEMGEWTSFHAIYVDGKETAHTYLPS